MLIGIDLAKAERWESLMKKYPKRIEKIFTKEELKHCRNKGSKMAESLAALWAVREAAGKALGIGFISSGWRDAYVSWTDFKNRAIALGVQDMAVSITHEDSMAAAVVIMTGATHEIA